MKAKLRFLRISSGSPLLSRRRMISFRQALGGRMTLRGGLGRLVVAAMVLALALGVPAVSAASTATTLSMTISGSSSRAIVSGNLIGADGQAVNHAAITIAVDGAAVGTVNTNKSGAYQAQISLANGMHTISASFAGNPQYTASSVQQSVQVGTQAPTPPASTAAPSAEPAPTNTEPAPTST
ncbi:MAG: hypothetical protein ACK5KO_04685, partial [Arachnia sp.]